MHSLETYSAGDSPLERERLIVVRNPVAHHAADWEAYVDDLAENTDFYYPLVISSEPHPEDTADKLAGLLKDGDLVCVLGGDGLGNDIVQYTGRTDAPEVAMMFAPFGNARNNYRSTVHPRFGDQPSKILRSAVERDIHPLRAVVEGEESYERLAISIISVGAIATGAMILDSPKHRAHPLRQNERTRFAYEVFLSLAETLPQTRTLEVSDVDGSNTRLALDIFAAAAPEIAKVAKFDTDIIDFDFLTGNIPDKLPWHVLPAMQQLMNGTIPVDRIRNGEAAVSFRLTNSKRNTRAMIQFDGEARKLLMNCLVSIDQPGYDDPTHRPIPTVIT